MKTVFKEGMTVYDSLNFPNKKGFIRSINMDNYKGKYPIIVVFKEEYKNDSIQSYTLEGVYKLDSIPTLSTKPYEIELKGFEQKPPIPTYEEILLKNSYISITKPLILPYEKLSNAFEALAKLIWLRDCYNDGWKPDWNNRKRDKFCIMVDKGILIKESFQSNNKVFAFKTEEVRDNFFEEQRALLEIAKPLL